MANITLFAQAIAKLPKGSIRKIIKAAGTDKHCKGNNTWSQFIGMVYCQFSNCDSVRDISNGPNSANGNLNHLGFNRAPSKLMPIKLLDSTLVSLTMSLYEWARHTATKGAVKMHTLLDYDSLLPEFAHITNGKGTDNKAALQAPIPMGAVVVADRGYYRHHTQRRGDTDMDGAGHHVAIGLLLGWLKHIANYK